VGRRLARHLETQLAESPLLAAIARRSPRGRGAWAVDVAFADDPEAGLARALTALPTPRALRGSSEAVARWIRSAAPASVALVGARGPRTATLLGSLPGVRDVRLIEDRADVVEGVEAALAGRVALTVDRVASAALAAGLASLSPGRVELVVLEGTLDVLPDRLARTLLRLAARWLAPGGALVIAATPDTADRAFWDHVAGWPLIRRTPAAIRALMARARLEDLPFDGPVVVAGRAP